MKILPLQYIFFLRNSRNFSFLYKPLLNNFIKTEYSKKLFKKSKFFKSFDINRYFMDLSSILTIVEKVIPPELAEGWDKTGLLINPDANNEISSILFTIDLTEAALEEAISVKANLIIAYHPPIFSPMSKLLCQNWKDSIVIQCVKHSIAVYSPHTACDAVKGGVNDWLIKCLDVCEVQPIHGKEALSDKQFIIEFAVPLKINMDNIVKSIIDCKVLSINTHGETQYVRLISSMNQSSVLKTLAAHGVQFVSTNAAIKTDLANGIGRIAKLKSPLSVSDCIKAVKSYLKLEHIRVAFAVEHYLDTKIERVAVCAGSGASVLKDVPADLYITGEMSHHDILHAIHNHVSIILCEHSNSERGYLYNLIEILQPQLRNIKLNISTADKDPISIH